MKNTKRANAIEWAVKVDILERELSRLKGNGFVPSFMDSNGVLVAEVIVGGNGHVSISKSKMSFADLVFLGRWIIREFDEEMDLCAFEAEGGTSLH